VVVRGPVDRLRERILRHTQLTSPPLCPEIRARLITPDCPLWWDTEQGAEEQGVPWPFWGFAWAGGQALARFVLDHPELVSGRRVLDLGCGCGIGAIATALAGAGEVLAADIDPFAAAATAINAELNGVAVETTTENLVGTPASGWDVLLAGDMYYDGAEAALTSAWLRQQADAGVAVLIGDPGRGFLRTEGLSQLAELDAPTDNDPTRTVRTGIYRWGRSVAVSRTEG